MGICRKGRRCTPSSQGILGPTRPTGAGDPPAPCRFPPPSFRVLAEPSHCSRQASVTADPGRGRGGD